MGTRVWSCTHVAVCRLYLCAPSSHTTCPHWCSHPCRYCCKYGGGSYYQLIVGNTVFKQGGEFTFTESVPFKNQPLWKFDSLPFSAVYV